MNQKASIFMVSGNLASRNAVDCLKSLKANTSAELVREIIIIEAGIRPDFNHAEEINRIMHIFKGDFLVLLDDDVILEPGWLDGLIGCAQSYKDSGIIGAVLKNRKGRIIHTGGDVTDTYFGVEIKEPITKPTERKYACSAVMLITRKAIEKIGQFDQGYRKYGQETDYCLRAWEAGFKVIVTPDAKAVHLVGQTVNLRPDMKDLWEKDRARFYHKWRNTPFYNKYEIIDLSRRGVVFPFLNGNGNDGTCNADSGALRPLHEVKQEIDLLKNRYNLQYIDIPGSFLAEQKYFYELVSYCKSIGLFPALVTDGKNTKVIADLIGAGLEDLLIKIPVNVQDCNQALENKSVCDDVVKTVEVIKSKEFGFRTTTTVTNFKHLSKLTLELIAMGPRIADFVLSDSSWVTNDIDFPGYSEVAPYLKEAIDKLMSAGIWVNVRYFPLCLIKGYEQHVCNFHQEQWDPYQWDYFQVNKFEEKDIRKIRHRVSRKKYFGHVREERMKLWIIKNRICAKNRFFKQCLHCANRGICDGICPQYVKRFGSAEFVAIEGDPIRDPLYYRKKNQTWRMLKPITAVADVTLVNK